VTEIERFHHGGEDQPLSPSPYVLSFWDGWASPKLKRATRVSCHQVQDAFAQELGLYMEIPVKTKDAGLVTATLAILLTLCLGAATLLADEAIHPAPL
jgi:hypothetical protein